MGGAVTSHMKQIYICHPCGKTETLYAPLGQHVRDIARQYPRANVFWVGAPLDTKPEDYRVIRYTPE